MYEAFTQSQSESVDIFGLAESLASGEPPPDLLQELVQKSDFIAELQEILDEAPAIEQDLSNRKEDLIQQRMETDLSTPNFKHHLPLGALDL